MKMYYLLDESGVVLSVFRLQQTEITGLLHLDISPFDVIESKWNGISWELDLTYYKKQKRDTLKEYIRDNLGTEITKDLTQIRNQWSSFKLSVIAAKTKDEVDSLFENAYNWLLS